MNWKLCIAVIGSLCVIASGFDTIYSVFLRSIACGCFGWFIGQSLK